MTSYVSNLYDCRRLTVPEELTRWRIGPEEVDQHLKTLARSQASEIAGDVVRPGDSVRLRCVSGTLADRMVLLYPGLGLPGAEEAEQAVLGLKAGDALTAAICGAAQSLTVEEIRRRVGAPVDDDLACAQGIEGVTTLAEYRRWYQDQAEEQNKANARKGIAAFLQEELRSRSEYALDPEEAEAWAEQRFQDGLAEFAAMGEDIQLPQEALDQMKEQAREDFKDLLVCREICRQAGVSLAQEDIQEEFEAMLPPGEDLGMTEEELEHARQLFLEGAPVTKAFEVLCGEADRYLED